MGKFLSIFPAVIAATELGLSDQKRAEIVKYIVANKDIVRKKTQPGYAKLGNFDITDPLSANDISYTPQLDLCLVFPSTLHHGVARNSSERPRLSIAVDTLFPLKEYTRDEPLLPPPSDWRAYPMS